MGYATITRAGSSGDHFSPTQFLRRIEVKIEGRNGATKNNNLQKGGLTMKVLWILKKS